MFHTTRYPSRMRFFRDSANGNHDNISPRDFPHLFAVCRGLDPQPQFQIIRIERLRGFDEYALYRFTNEPFENVEWNIIHRNMDGESRMGQMSVYRPRNNQNDESMRVRFQIHNIFLGSRDMIFPIVILDNFTCLPFTNAVIIPRNARVLHDSPYTRNDPNLTIHYLMDRHNFLITNFNLTNRVIDRLDSYRRNQSYNRDHDRDWYNDYPHDFPLEDREYDTVFHNHSAAGGGAARSIRNTRQDTPPITPPPPARDNPRDNPRSRPVVTEVSLQAFTIQALINHAISESMTCPISMNPIQKSTACVTSCQHIFERDSIAHWLSDHTNCPVCRQATSICN